MIDKPAAGQIAVLMPGDGSQTVERRDVLLTTQQGFIRRINEMHHVITILTLIIIETQIQVEMLKRCYVVNIMLIV